MTPVNANTNVMRSLAADYAAGRIDAFCRLRKPPSLVADATASPSPCLYSASMIRCAKRALYRLRLRQRIKYAFDESKHPRGQPDNPGEFAKSPGGKSQPKRSGKKEFAKAPAVRGEMQSASRTGKGKDAKIILANGKDAPPHIKPSMVPPNWTDVTVSVDPKAEVLVQGRDKAGRSKTVYSDEFHMRNAAVKFARVMDMHSQSHVIASEIQRDRSDPQKRDAADCTWLMLEQATRPGSDSDTKAKVRAYGATTLTGDHVVVGENGDVRLDFIGKEGVHHNHLIRNPELAQMLVDRKRTAASRGGKLFDTNYAKVASYAGTLDGGKFSPKDFRTLRANQLAIAKIAEFSGEISTKKEYNARVKSVAEHVSGVLGNRWKQALDSYINPAVFSVWKEPS